MISVTLPSGVRCFVEPKKGYVEKQAVITVRFGSDTACFSLNGKKILLPQGTAHFIEHKMFDMPDGNMMDKFYTNGAEVNAFTTFDETAYYFSCIDNFYENLEMLIKMVSTPCFLKESIQKEKSIIASEINMYKDDPGWQCYFSLLKNMYPNSPVSNVIAGTESEIEKIDDRIMRLCYDTFYIPENTALIAAGDIDAQRVLDIAQNAFELPEKCSYQTEICKDGKAVKTFCKSYSDVKKPLFYIGIKDRPKTVTAKDTAETKVIMDALAGDCSPVFKRLNMKGLLDEPLTCEYLQGRDYSAMLFSGASDSPEKVLEELVKISEDTENIQSVIKKHKGRLYMQQDSLNGICMAAADCFAKNIELLDIYDVYDKIECRKKLSFDTPFLSVVSGKR